MTNEALREAISRGEAEGDEPETVEPETPDDTDEEGEAETPPPVPPVEAPPLSERDIEQRNEKLDREAKRHAGRIGEIMGEDAQVLQPCPLCLDNAPGFIVPAGMVEYAPEEKAAVMAALGEQAPPPLREAEGVAMCDRCDGFGQLSYPTRVPHVETQACPKCSGSGYVNTPAPPSSNGPSVYLAPPPLPTVTGFGGYQPPDLWNRPHGHPHYGIPPAEVGA